MGEATDTVELPNDVVEDVLEELESGMRNGKMAHSHDDIRPSTVGMAKSHKEAYEMLVTAHPEYELTDE